MYKLTNTIIQNEQTIPIIGYFYKNRILKIIDKLEIHFDLPRVIEYPKFKQLIEEQIEQGKLFCIIDASVDGNEMGGYWIIINSSR